MVNMKRICSLCKSNFRSIKHRYPINPMLRKQWINFAVSHGFEPNTSGLVCEYHFDPTKDYNIMRTRKKLNKNAVPSILLQPKKNYRKLNMRTLQNSQPQCPTESKITNDPLEKTPCRSIPCDSESDHPVQNTNGNKIDDDIFIVDPDDSTDSDMDDSNNIYSVITKNFKDKMKYISLLEKKFNECMQNTNQNENSNVSSIEKEICKTFFFIVTANEDYEFKEIPLIFKTSDHSVNASFHPIVTENKMHKNKNVPLLQQRPDYFVQHTNRNKTSEAITIDSDDEHENNSLLHQSTSSSRLQPIQSSYKTNRNIIEIFIDSDESTENIENVPLLQQRSDHSVNELIDPIDTQSERDTN